MRKIIVYKNVFDRENPFEAEFNAHYLSSPQFIFDHFGQDFEKVEKVKTIADKQQRNDFKRANLPAMGLSQSGLLAIDIDGISENRTLFSSLLRKLIALDYCYCVKESVSGNLVAFFKYDCSVEDYPYLYYKLYLELTLLLGVNIDFLPEIGRLRYVGLAGFYSLNENSEVLTQTLKVGTLPSIKTSLTPRAARSIKYGSR